MTAERARAGAPAGVHVHVVRVDLDDEAHALGDLMASLDADEVAAARRRAPSAMRRYVVAHAARRAAVGAVVGCAPREVAFAAPGPRGQPRLAAEGVHVSLSHSGSYGLVAVAVGAAVGVDVERHRPRRTEALAQRALSPDERRGLLDVPPAARPAAFYRCWVRKEALLKATGTGLADLQEVTATPAPAGWTVLDLAGGPDHSAAVAVAAVSVTVHEARWPDPAPHAGAAGR